MLNIDGINKKVIIGEGVWLWTIANGQQLFGTPGMERVKGLAPEPNTGNMAELRLQLSSFWLIFHKLFLLSLHYC